MIRKDEVLQSIKEAKTSISTIDGLEQFNDDIDIANVLIERSGTYLEYLSDRFKDDKEIVTKAVNSDGRSIRYASQSLQQNKDIIEVAIQNNSAALDYLSLSLFDKFDRNEIIKFVKSDSNIYVKLPYKYKEDLQIARLVLSSSSKLYLYRDMPEEIRDNKELAISVVSENFSMYQYISDRLKNDKEIFDIVFAKNCELAIEHASNQLLKALGSITVEVSRTRTSTIENVCKVEILATEFKESDLEELFDEENCSIVSEDYEDEYVIN